MGMRAYVGRTSFDMSEYNEYCYIVAGLVGEGLTRLFNGAGESIEDPGFKLSVSMGRLLQKTNIIRDFQEDYREGRVFWPRDIARLYYEDDVGEFLRDHAKGVRCVDHLVADALSHLPDCLDYLRQVQDPRNFRFCAIPQLMALSTLHLCLSNEQLFQTSVKTRRGLTARLVLSTSDYHSFCSLATLYVDEFVAHYEGHPQHQAVVKSLRQVADRLTRES